MVMKNHWARFLFSAVTLAVLAALALYAYLGVFTRYMADDYCSSAALKSAGFWGAQSFWWKTWSGRYSFSFLISLVELLGVRIVPILPALILSLWIFSISWACIPFLKRFNVSNHISAGLFIAAMALWLTYRSFEDYPQIVFWQTGILTYPVAPIFFLLGTGIAMRRSFRPAKLGWLEIILWFWFAFLAGGFSETGAVIQITLLAFLLFLLWIFRKGKGSIFVPILLASLCGSVLSLFVMSLSTGNLARPGGFQKIPALSQSLPGSIQETFRFIPHFINHQTTVIIFGLLAGAFLVYFCFPKEVRFDNSFLGWHYAGSLLVCLVSIWAGIAPAYVLRVGLPPERVLLYSTFILVGVVMYWGALSALLLRQNLPIATLSAQTWLSLGCIIFMMAWAMYPYAVSQVKMVPALKLYSTIWDDRHQQLLAASQNHESSVVTDDLLKVDALYWFKDKLWLAGDFDSDPDYWINQCAAQYYQVNQIIAK